MAKHQLTVVMTPDVIAAAITRFALLEIVQAAKRDPYGFSGEDAAHIAGRALKAANKMEAASGT